MILDQMVDVLVEFIEKIYQLYRSGELTETDYAKLTANKLLFIENHIDQIKKFELKYRCESLLAINGYNLQGSTTLLH
ncbi:MAG: hypothetical protein N2484_12210 [Clostridia bacterium]|nr:hypothetical protein [Clostridia bacterium]